MVDVMVTQAAEANEVEISEKTRNAIMIDNLFNLPSSFPRLIILSIFFY